MTAMAASSTGSPPSGCRPSCQAAPRRRTRGAAWSCSSTPGWPTSCCRSCRRCALEIDEHHQHKDVYEHTLTVLEQAIELEEADRPGVPGPRAAAGRAAARHRQAGDPAVRAAAGGSASTTTRWSARSWCASGCTALRYPKAWSTTVARLSFLHLRFHGYGGGEWTDSAVRRYVTDAGPLLAAAAQAGPLGLHHPQPAPGGGAAAHLRRAGGADRASCGAQEDLDAVRPDLDGNAIMELLGIGPGPLVGQAWRFLKELRLERGPLDPDDAEAASCARWWAGRS